MLLLFFTDYRHCHQICWPQPFKARWKQSRGSSSHQPTRTLSVPANSSHNHYRNHQVHDWCWNPTSTICNAWQNCISNENMALQQRVLLPQDVQSLPHWFIEMSFLSRASNKWVLVWRLWIWRPFYWRWSGCTSKCHIAFFWSNNWHRNKLVTKNDFVWSLQAFICMQTFL